MLLRRAVFLLLGAVVLLPCALVAGVLVQAVRAGDPGGLITGLVALTAAAVPPFLAGTRELEIAATRALLGTDLPPPEPGRPALETRLRAALWFGLHLVTGGLVAAALVVAVPLALLAFTERLGITRGQLGGDRWLWTAAGVALLAATFYATKWLGALAHAMAPVLLGPSPAEREAALAARERALADRNRLARELHDSVGHALTATTLQAGAARAVFDRDPEFARRALGAIEELGRTALDELDAVLGVLRDDAPDRTTTPNLGVLRDDPAGRTTAPTLDDLGRLLTDEITAEVAAVDVPEPVSREAYRIVQESLTNAARHGAGEVRLRLGVEGDRLIIEVRNRLAAGRGVTGMRERVMLLGGDLTAGPDGEEWRLRVRLPC
ncbi:sensor histidine kinase [Paractinoplanes rishiriensis]|uniref:histidine kinase n=1 Tax=Paractinoplanes rishiriensis TaxID=1050105 RepID=A0A919JXK4_9ACTN|nr:histidine kinase [Actinoplanes rishiriensis]GIE95142.1 histidine kinase [Actinoplanes rishiriensis]